MFLFQKFMKTAPWHILNTHIERVIKLDQVISLNNILVIESAKELNFLSEQRNYLISSLIFFQYFHSHYLIIRNKLGTVDIAEWTLPYFLIELVKFINAFVNVISVSLCIQIIENTVEYVLLNLFILYLIIENWRLFCHEFYRTLLLKVYMSIEKLVIFVTIVILCLYILHFYFVYKAVIVETCSRFKFILIPIILEKWIRVLWISNYIIFFRFFEFWTISLIEGYF